MADLDQNQAKLAELEAAIAQPDFWQDKARAQATLAEYQRLKADLWGGQKYDRGHAIITILSGAGGDDAEDFSAMLFRMYSRFAERQNLAVSILHQNQNTLGGYRNLTFLVRGDNAYGILKNESGVHRLVRISPFDANKRRHTSFSLVEVVPELDQTAQIDINPDELKVEFARSSGPGGQNVNKRETAVRLTHTPTGLTVHIDSERSQERNRDRARQILRGKLFKLAEERRAAEAAGLKISHSTDIEWGNQIRSYVLHPYQLVKDHRTGHETAKVDEVLDGDLALIQP